MVKSKCRGNEIYFNEGDKTWYYKDTNLSVPSTHLEHKCGNCGKNYTEEGHDGCLGTLIGLMNACCGHGNIEEAYVQFWDGECVRGEDANIIQDILKKYKKERTKEDEMERLEFLKGYMEELESNLSNKIGFAKCTVLGSYLEFGIYYQEGLFTIKNKNITIELLPSIFTSKLIQDEITILFGWKEIIEILKEDCRKRIKDCKTMFAHLRFEADLKTLDDILDKFKDMENDYE